MRSILTLFTFCITLTCLSQNITSNQLLENAISYHDPDNNWDSFKGEFTVVMTTPNSPKRTSQIKIDLAKDYFSVNATKDTITTVYVLDKGICSMEYNGKTIDHTKALKKDMSCDKASRYKNYYTYLYGLPMKLKDPGTNLRDRVEKKIFNGINYLVLKVTYDETVGKDVWYFYFNPKTFAMEVYQFYKTDEKGQVNPESGEYILLNEETLINGIKMPKVRAWYYNNEDKYLGTDTLEHNSD